MSHGITDKVYDSDGNLISYKSPVGTHVNTKRIAKTMNQSSSHYESYHGEGVPSGPDTPQWLATLIFFFGIFVYVAACAGILALFSMFLNILGLVVVGAFMFAVLLTIIFVLWKIRR